jgi:hypothetical protein
VKSPEVLARDRLLGSFKVGSKKPEVATTVYTLARVLPVSLNVGLQEWGFET